MLLKPAAELLRMAVCPDLAAIFCRSKGSPVVLRAGELFSGVSRRYLFPGDLEIDHDRHLETVALITDECGDVLVKWRHALFGKAGIG